MPFNTPANNRICRFYQQGNCRYGASCNFVHQQAGSKAKTVDDMSIDEIIVSIGREMQEWTTTGTWPLSCFSVSKGWPSLDGFNDVSPEELRVDAYLANRNGSSTEYVTRVGQLVAEANQKRQALTSPSPTVRQLLVQYITSNKQQSSQKTIPASNSTFGANSTQSLFGNKGSVLTPSVFGSTPVSQQSTFGSSTPLFGSATSSPNTGEGLFGQKSTPPATNSLFGAQPTSSNSLFGQQNTQQNSLFQGSGTQQNNLFGGQQPSSATSLFGSQTSSAFPQPSATTQPTSSVFPGSTSNTTLFGASNSQSSGAFNLATPSSTAEATNTPAMTTTTTTTPSTLAATSSTTLDPDYNPSYYTPMAELTPEERRAYEADAFTDFVPVKPPPVELR